ncbi:hypothetical protein SSX86_020709 [Deinandra increscens subsp. villosa]|uniref:TCP domain-containing protein n=1 Tax=Deinandra increscens subsp. villosa TaxID=3103831 RepID=A0AAP0CT83_9ASTR
MDTTTILPNLDHGCRTTTTTKAITKNSLPSKLKCVRKRKTAGKKDRQSKIHTAQGLRDRRMRLSVHTARKFFDLNDMLGFDKASKTIEWLFSKSHEAIQEITDQTLQPDAACETQSAMEIVAEKGDQIEEESSRKEKESKSKLERIRDRIMIKNLGKTKELFQEDPPSVDNFHLSQLDDHNMKESSCYPMEFSNTYHFLKHLHLDNNSVTNNHSIFDYNKTIAESPTWLNSRNPFLGFLGGWNSENPRMGSSNRMDGNMNGEKPCSNMMSSNFMNFSSENQGE